MSRSVDEPIDVTLGPGSIPGQLEPKSFRFRGERHQVAEIWDYWVMTGQWWEDAGAVGRPPGEAHFWRVLTRKGGVFELVREQSGEWRLWKTYD